MQPSVPAPCPCQPQPQLPSQPMGQSLGAQPPTMVQPTAPPSLAPPPVTTQPASPRAVPSYGVPRPSSTESAGSAAPRPSYPAPPPGAGSLSTPSNSPPAAPPAANPATPPASGNPYAPPDGSFNFRGGSTQQSTPSGTQTADARLGAPTFTSVAVTRSSSAGGPRPVDDPPADASLSGRQPIVRTLQPRAKDGSSDRSVDIVDLPQKPASAP